MSKIWSEPLFISYPTNNATKECLQTGSIEKGWILNAVENQCICLAYRAFDRLLQFSHLIVMENLLDLLRQKETLVSAQLDL